MNAPPHQLKDHFKPAVGYLRRSTDRQEQSLDGQRQAIEAYAAREAFSVLKWFVDDAISGTMTEARKAFLAMVAEAQEPGCPFRYVLVYDVKRFGRVDTDEAGYYRHLLRQVGVEVVYVSEGFNGGDSDDLIRSVKQWQARVESKDLSKVTIRGQLSVVDKGYWGGGVPPFGYDLLYEDAAGQPIRRIRFAIDGSKEEFDARGVLVRVHPRGTRLARPKTDRPRLVLSDPGRVALIKRIFRMYARRFHGYRSIANELNSDAIPCPRSGTWRGTTDPAWGIGTIRSILLNGTYTGDTYWNRRSYAKFHRIASRLAQERPRHRADKPDWNPRNDWIVVRNTHPAIIDRESYEEVLRRPSASKRRGGAAVDQEGTIGRSAYLLSGLLRCACGHAFCGQVTRKGKKRKSGDVIKTAYYLCGGYLQKGRKWCIRRALPKEEMEFRVWKLVVSRMTILPSGFWEGISGNTLSESDPPSMRRVTKASSRWCINMEIRRDYTVDQKVTIMRLLIRQVEISPKNGHAVVSWRFPTK